MANVKVGIIGGSGLYESGLFEHSETIKTTTPFGAPSAAVEIGSIDGMKVAFLPRHGKGHVLPPHSVNYRANIWAMKDLGVERIISPCAVGSLKEQMRPGDFCTPDQFIDFTKSRRYTFYDGGKTSHVSAADPFCPELSKLFYDKGKEQKLRIHPKGTYVCVEGPRFSTRAESRMFRQYADIIGMTLVPEVNLAIEMGMCYVSVAMITDYDVWAEKPVDAKEIIATMTANTDNVRRLMKAAIPAIKDRKCRCADAIKHAGI
ncbi:MAG: S-methyl-5'-thioadenosine phosphorylase [Euryarchaeota archaeon]|nr:S-methyl-5'-thioadenosine phosphorylase [Euryarchaeota archaeon]